ncbi:PREDICTED: uncharacterized protein LOC106122142 isoform X1 [Papilio xuthus]|uniref:Uncharacterized protein LOC106122142 isoform X1 n=1 Tax=Papilio xuthus TaxID=66420 RepID=A0A0N1PGB8_PAPXU|nr:PREDICTED: uncharacterized protein LOC106122142 isoform X1 [Papilio xuthus]KPJ04288.1 hypothetical protein RR46_01572 [Papilio xuthus]
MASSDPELSDGITLPVWMKTKPVKEFEPFAASPPAPEDSFFYIRYPKTDVLFGKPKVGDIPKLINEQQKDLAVKAAYSTIKEQDWSKHTKPCQDVLHGIAPIHKPVDLKPASVGTEDGFKGEGAACGNSVVKVAHQMIQSNRSPRGFTVASPTEEEAVAPTARQYNLQTRRGSKSLPATPAHSPPSSPTGRRRMIGNRYFTSPFEPVEDSSNRSWLTMALLGFKKDLTTSTSTLAEEDTIEHRLQGGTLAESVENLGPSPRGKEPKLMSNETSTQQPKLTKPAHAFRPKPSELREMNFWSPTSM